MRLGCKSSPSDVPEDNDEEESLETSLSDPSDTSHNASNDGGMDTTNVSNCSCITYNNFLLYHRSPLALETKTKVVLPLLTFHIFDLIRNFTRF